MNTKQHSRKMRIGKAILWILEVALLTAMGATMVRGKLPWEP